MGRLARRQLGDGIWHVHNRSANNIYRSIAPVFISLYISCIYRIEDWPFLMQGLRGGKLFPRTPISTLCRAFMGRGLRPCYRGGPTGLTCRPLAANSSPPACGGLRQRAFASLRSTASLSLLAACFGLAEPCGALTSATRRLPRFCIGRQRSGPGRIRQNWCHSAKLAPFSRS